MAAAGLQVFQYAILTDAQGKRHLLGSMVDPANLSADLVGEVENLVYTLDAAETRHVYIPQTAASAVQGFSFLWVRANVEDCFIQVTTDTNNSVGTQEQTFKLRKNLAFVLGSNISYANYTSPFFGGTLDVIDEVRVTNTGSQTANIEVVLAR